MSSDKVIHVTDDSFESEVKQSCGSCFGRFLGFLVCTVQGDQPACGPGR